MEAIIFVGIQASGKSTFYRERFFDTHLRINLDMLKTRYREQLILRACIEAKQPFVVDNTNPSVEERARYIRPARSGGFRVVGYYFGSRVREALARNSDREGKERIPEKGILGTYKRLRVPGLEEGFELLRYVRIDEEGRFVVEEWSDAE
ncbi:MAG: ATP-binding protein [Actinomycetota bacterium]|nr:ATP-binding protein [Actinomycetota bacterium]